MPREPSGSHPDSLSPKNDTKVQEGGPQKQVKQTKLYSAFLNKRLINYKMRSGCGIRLQLTKCTDWTRNDFDF